ASVQAAQAAFRVGDSITNMLAPSMPFFPLFIAVVKKHAPGAGAGTVAALTLPYSIAFAVVWTALFAVWLFTGFPFGPG
ncbi:MAG: AbgT family transporter, partial [Polyangiaceae bacterium]